MTTTAEWTAERTFVEHEHRELIPGINRIHEVACSVGTVPATDLSRALREVMAWVDGVLQPHAAWEEQWLYPELDQRAGTPHGSTVNPAAAMSEAHSSAATGVR